MYIKEYYSLKKSKRVSFLFKADDEEDDAVHIYSSITLGPDDEIINATYVSTSPVFKTQMLLIDDWLDAARKTFGLTVIKKLNEATSK